MTPRLMVLKFRYLCHIGPLMFVRTVYCLLALNTFYGTSVAINYVLEKFWYRGVQNSLAKRQTVIEGSFAGHIRKTHSKRNHVLWTSVTINYLLKKIWYRGVQTSLAKRQTVIEGSFAGRMRKIHSKWNHVLWTLLPLITSWKILIQGLPNFFGKATNRHWRVLLQDARVKLTVGVIRTHPKYSITCTV